METAIYPPELQQEPFMVSRNLTIMLLGIDICILIQAGTLCSQQEPHNYAFRHQCMHLNSSRNPLQSAGTLICNQQKLHEVSRNPLWPAGTLGGTRNFDWKKQFIHLSCSKNPSWSAGTSQLCFKATIYAS